MINPNLFSYTAMPPVWSRPRAEVRNVNKPGRMKERALLSTYRCGGDQPEEGQVGRELSGGSGSFHTVLSNRAGWERKGRSKGTQLGIQGDGPS